MGVAFYILLPLVPLDIVVCSMDRLGLYTPEQRQTAAWRLFQGALVHRRMGLPGTFADLMNSPAFRAENPINAQIVDAMMMANLHPDHIGPVNANIANLPAMIINEYGTCVASGYLRRVLQGHPDLRYLTQNEL